MHRAHLTGEPAMLFFTTFIPSFPSTDVPRADQVYALARPAAFGAGAPRREERPPDGQRCGPGARPVGEGVPNRHNSGRGSLERHNPLCLIQRFRILNTLSLMIFQVEVLLKHGTKAEVDALLHFSPSFITDVYLPNKIAASHVL